VTGGIRYVGWGRGDDPDESRRGQYYNIHIVKKRQEQNEITMQPRGVPRKRTHLHQEGNLKQPNQSLRGVQVLIGQNGSRCRGKECHIVAESQATPTRRKI